MARPDNLFETDNQNAHAPSDEQIAAMPPIFRRIWESIIASQRAQIGPVRIAEGDAGWQKAAREGLGIPLAYLANAVGLGFEGSANVGKVGVGSLLTTLGQINRASGLARALTPGFLEDPARQALASYEADTNGNPITAMMDANEAAASGNEFTVGVLDQLLDPANIADIAKGGKWLIEGAPKGARALGRLRKSLAGMGPEDATQLLPTGLDLSHHPNIPGNVPDIQMKPGIGFAGGGGLGPTLPSQPGNVPLEDLIAGIGTEGGGIGPVLPYRSGNANVLHGPDIPLMVNQPQMPPAVYRDLFGEAGNVPAGDLIPGVGKGGRPGLGPELPLDVLHDRPTLEEALRGNVPRNQLRPGIGAMVDGKNPRRMGIGPTVDELLYGPYDPGPPPYEPGIKGNVPAAELTPGIGAMVGRKNPRRLGLGPAIPPGFQNDRPIEEVRQLLEADWTPGNPPGNPKQGPAVPLEQGPLLRPEQRALTYADEVNTDLLTNDEILALQGNPRERRALAQRESDLALPPQYEPARLPLDRKAEDRYLRGLGDAAGDWSSLSADEIDALLQVAYPSDPARANAMLKYRDPAELASRAWDRISHVATDDQGRVTQRTSSAALADFQRQYPDLARKLAYMPPLEETRALAAEQERTQHAIDTIKSGPYAQVFKYFDKQGRLKINPGTGEAIRPRRREDLGEILGRPGWRLDEIADQAMGAHYGSAYWDTSDSKHAFGSDDEFWTKAQEQFLEYQRLTAKEPVDELGFTTDGRYLGIMPGKPNRTALLLQNAGLGGIGGYAAGQGGTLDGETSDDERNAAIFGAVVGGAIGGAAGSRAGQAIIRLVPHLWENGIAAQREAWRAGRGMSLADIGRVWKTQTTSTIRNLLQDEVISRLWLARAGVRQRVMNENWYSLVDLYERGIRDGYEALPQRSRMLLDRIGKGPTFGPTRSGRGLLAKSNPGYVPGLGQSLSEANDRLVRALHPLTTAKIEAGLSLATPLASVPVAGVALGAVKGLTRAAWTEVFQSINHFTHAAARHAVWQESMVDDLAQAAERFTRIDPALSRLSPDGLFSADEVFNLTGDRSLADQWGAVVDEAIARGEARAKEVFGDFSNEQWWERGLSSVVPFASWAIRAYPRTIAMMAEHPGITLAILAAVERDSQRAKEEGRPGYQVGSLKFDSQTPVLGKLLGGMLAGGQGDLRVNILGALSPFSGELFAGADDSAEEQTPYQKVKGLVGKTGFSFNPFLVGLAYALDWDYIRPGAMSRTAGIEQAIAGPEIPSAMQGPLDFVRERMGGSVSKTSPTERRWAQNLYDETGYAAGAPQNAAIAAASVLPGDPRMALAERQTGQGGLVRNLASLILPATVSAETDTAAYARRSADYARENPPVQVDPAIMESLKTVNPLAAILLQDTQRNMVGEGALINRDADQTSRAYAALQAWSDENANMRYFMPAYYWEKEGELRKLLGLPPRKD